MRSGYMSACAAVRVFTFALLAWILVCGNAGAGGVPPGVVRGVVWTSDNLPIPNAKVRLVNLETGRRVARAEGSARGDFVFERVERGHYVVELVSETERVLAVGPGFYVEPQATVSTLVRLAVRRSWYAGMFSNTSAGVIAAASSAGLTAIGSHAPPISPQ